MAGQAPGTRFRLFPQFAEGLPAEVVAVSSPAGSLRPGPADHRMYVANAISKAQPYAPPAFMPPYAGAVHPPAEPDAEGHFDSLDPDTPQFRAAHLWGTVRLVLDVVEPALGEAVPWWQPLASGRVELVPEVAWQNAQSGPGFLETGFWPDDRGAKQPFCLNFDVIAHEVGHEILFGLLGAPRQAAVTAPFLALHEFFGDMVALLGSLHFASVRRRLLEQTEGNLYALNLVSRLAETAPHQQIRIASNDVTMHDVAGLALRADGSWFDPLRLGRNAHDLSLPLLGATFDVLAELFQQGLAARGLIAPDDDARGWSRAAAQRALRRLQDAHRSALWQFADGFEAALVSARDCLLAALLKAARSVDPARVTFDAFAGALWTAVATAVPRAERPSLLACFGERGIDALAAALAVPRSVQGTVRPSRRAALAKAPGHLPPPRICRDPAGVLAARRLMPHAHRGG